ncbi:MAG: rhodanese [Rhodospirillaceae bacterium]|nr:rhodanese [Rhodospirillaceae bacterium]|tara:strand:+ start:1262 stop:1669 length:408 start_codon:yes stop_codon:yes gene_type:complete
MALKTTVKEMVAAANEEIRSIDVEEIKTLLQDDGVQIVDIRDVRELDREGMIPGALHAPRGMLEFWVDPQSPYHKEVFASGKTFVFYCASAWRSALATKAVQDMGLEPVADIKGGFSAWKEAGGDIVERPSRKKD